MDMKNAQKQIDDWINKYGVRYFDEKTNMLVLMEEVGELSRLMSRKYGEQSFKEKWSNERIDEMIQDEVSDVLFVLICLSNQMGIDLEAALKNNLEKKSLRDSERHRKNPKLDSKE